MFFGLQDPVPSLFVRIQMPLPISSFYETAPHIFILLVLWMGGKEIIMF
jgi:hypothetical protein